jgi:hypothetical protein
MNTTNNTNGIYTHEQFVEDMEWSGQLHAYRSRLREMKNYLESAISGTLAPDLLDRARSLMIQLVHQQYHLDEIAHTARMNEYALLSRMNCDAEAIELHRKASRIKEQSLLQFFGKRFMQLASDYSCFCSDAEVGGRQCG